MDHNTIYVGMDVHKETISLCCYSAEKDEYLYPRTTSGEFREVLSYIVFLQTAFGKDVNLLCGYEAGCLGFTLYHVLTKHNIKCVILAPTTMMVTRGKRKIKTDRRDARNIAKCMANRSYNAVHIPTEKDEQVKEFIRMRQDHKLALKKIKQQILAFCLRHNLRYEGKSRPWTQAHIAWLRGLKPDGHNSETLTEYLLTFDYLTGKLERLDKRIEELASDEEYKESVGKLSCFLGVKTHTALSVIVEVGDFKRFSSAQGFASYIGLVPGEDSSGGSQKRLGITKAGNTYVRTLLVEAAQSFSRGKIGHKSKALIKRQSGNPPEVIEYADKANERMRRRYYSLVIGKYKKPNVAKTAVARELACFIWGMMVENVA